MEERAAWCGDCLTTFPRHLAHGHLTNGLVVLRQVSGPPPLLAIA